jgi:hypothetical protein
MMKTSSRLNRPIRPIRLHRLIRRHRPIRLHRLIRRHRPIRLCRLNGPGGQRQSKTPLRLN